jgi:uncharacterized protein YndB with AHSA1/START domain
MTPVHNDVVTDSVAVSTMIAAPPEAVWDLISDVTRMGRWSPETVECRWLGGADHALVGARFVGVNARGGRRWRTYCRVVAADRGRAFAFEVTGGRVFRVAQWRYDLRPVDGGCDVTESWQDRRGRFMTWYGRRVIGVTDRREHNRRGMRETLARLKAAAEAGR